MNTKTQSLITNIASKRVLTPLEAIHFVYLNQKNKSSDVNNLPSGINKYLGIANMQPLIPKETMKNLLTFEMWYELDEFRGYQWAYDLLYDFDLICEQDGYKGMALLNELNLCYAQYALNPSKRKESEIFLASHQGLFEHKIYSIVCQQNKTYIELFHEFISTLYSHICTTDNILSLNFHLDQLIDLSELKCLKYLSIWFAEENNPSGYIFQLTTLDLIKMWCDKYLDTEIKTNHDHFGKYIRFNMDKNSVWVDENFETESLLYVNATIEKQIKLKKNS